jgi:hypothetical protein
VQSKGYVIGGSLANALLAITFQMAAVEWRDFLPDADAVRGPAAGAQVVCRNTLLHPCIMCDQLAVLHSKSAWHERLPDVDALRGPAAGGLGSSLLCVADETKACLML